MIYADGAYGGPTGHGLIYMALYSEHTKLPESARFDIDPASKTARPQRVTPTLNWIREVEAEVLMTVEFAKSLRQWLDQRIAVLESDTRDKIRIIDTADDAEQVDDNTDAPTTTS